MPAQLALRGDQVGLRARAVLEPQQAVDLRQRAAVGEVEVEHLRLERLEDAGDRVAQAADELGARRGLVGRRSDGAVGGYLLRGLIRNNDGTTALVGAPVVTVLGESVPAWEVAVQADTTNDDLEIVVTGGVGETIRWVAVLRTVEIAF